ncbi:MULTISPECIES: hypothetical protein [unclassified Microcoleus]|uniref:hypothetical protein n=1 Tax=unclassified Microcoleus TaxID=2642155 RepID=UPI002FD3D236
MANTRKNGIKIRASRFGKKPFLGVRSSRQALPIYLASRSDSEHSWESYNC